MSLRTLAIIAVLAAEAPSHAHADGVKVGALSLTATSCTLDGDPLVFADDLDHRGGLALAPNGDVIVLDGANRVRRYHVKSGKGCALSLDQSAGKHGVLDVGADAKRSSLQLAVDAGGTIYVSDVPRQPARVRDGKVEAMCGDATRVNASALSSIIWRYDWATKATREHGDCSGADSAYLKGWDVGASHLWVIDDRAVAYGEHDKGDQLLLYGADGARMATLASPDPGHLWVPERVARCGRWICALAIGGAIAVWDGKGALIGVAHTGALVGRDDGEVTAIDLDGALGPTYLLVQTGELGKRTAGAIVRIDGFTK